ncbi:hypothetical protein F0562_015089 [Nyssa sinensis]|uniref:K Homology domain-containing protein n=1 Tax=Nyssa sinensis TaxID=561372 RepID=A0A5J4ZGC4_9ASTE|nr:hypothetical protein F0562_015089 [Nyssa sinensis]
MSGLYNSNYSPARAVSPQIRSTPDVDSQYLSELLAEHQKLGPFMQVLPICSRLLNQEIFRVSGMMSNQGFGELDRLRQRSPSPMASSNLMSNVAGTGLGGWNGLPRERLSGPPGMTMDWQGAPASPSLYTVKRILRLDIPVDTYPNFNFVGRLLGPRGNSLKRLEATTGCRVYIRGKGSIKDPDKEEKLRGRPGYEHLNEPLHILIEADLPANIVDIRLRQAQEIIEELLKPVDESQDFIKRQQLRELAMLNSNFREESPEWWPSKLGFQKSCRILFADCSNSHFMASMAQLRYSPLAGHYHSVTDNISHISAQRFSFSPLSSPNSSTPSSPPNLFLSSPNSLGKFLVSRGAGNGNNGVGRGSGGSGSGGDGGWSAGGDSDDSSSWKSLGPIGAFLNGWRSRVAADPQFPFKVLMEELVGVSACVLGDMASRPNFGLNELDFVFSTLVVGSILNFVLMYLLAPTMSSSSSGLPSIFMNCPTSHMFEPGPYSLLNRFGTFVYKGTLFAAVGFAAGLVGTVISNGLIKMRKKMDPNFGTPNKPPPTVLNAVTWAIHMGVSSNLRYQTLNGIEFLLAKGLAPWLFKTSVVVLRCLNNVLGGMSFVILARLTGSQSVEKQKMVTAEEVGSAAEKEKLVNGGEDLQSNEPSSK